VRRGARRGPPEQHRAEKFSESHIRTSSPSRLEQSLARVKEMDAEHFYCGVGVITGQQTRQYRQSHKVGRANDSQGASNVCHRALLVFGSLLITG
jgi:hypothetical protein